ncbi:penicillin acylase family protein [Bradyrhizobium roseum]|uniref:penicillin acylase family protein n=1 Tax=Bradyrhizobium roseum TaxID=3056648 RepID=UPI00261756E7|nr:penicillin acylase family protein [Bradyrhizobium roseus]WKA26403.1 penicillin acylase family protein [Bradyrhizobium roseus]
MALIIRATIYGVILILLASLGLLGGAWLWLRTAVPERSISLVGPQSRAPILITRDSAGLPTIDATTDADAAFALGYIHAQDRMFQMDLMRRYGAGRLSEWFGRPTLGSDRFMRTLGIGSLVEKQYQRLSAPVRGLLRSYAEGVNAYSSGFHALPPEYYVLNTGFEPWRPEDSLIWAKIIDLELTGNFKEELLHAQLLKRVSPQELGVLFPTYPSTAPIVVQQTRADLENLPLNEIYASLPARIGPFEASNNWVISGSRSSSGKPLLANDPHLGFSIPSAWYLARLRTPSDILTGASAPGTPFILIGHNARIAWGITATRSDVEDIFIEKIDSDNPKQYLTPDGSRPFELREEIIAIKGEPSAAMTVRQTRHGPVISDLAAFARHVPSTGFVLSLQTTWLTSDDTSPEAAWELSRARDWEEFRSALRKLTAPQQNFVYADVEGNIGFIAPAKIPRRRKGNGWLPVPGWEGQYDWEDNVPFDELPAKFNPPNGAIATANNKLTDVPFLARDWIPPYRAERIMELLDRSDRFSIGDMAEMQFDTVSLAARQLVPLLPTARLKQARSRVLAEQVKHWDGRMDSDKIEPLIFSAWLRELTRSLLLPKLGPMYPDYAGFHPHVVHLIVTQHPDWCDDPATSEAETCDDQMARSFDRALAQLEKGRSDANDIGRWGDHHKAVYSHPLWSHVPVIADILGYRIPASGSTDTINNAVVSFRNERAAFQSVFGSTLRMIVDLADLDQTRFMIVPGQSGNPISKHYNDRVADWQQRRWLQFQK